MKGNRRNVGGREDKELSLQGKRRVLGALNVFF